MKLESIWVFSLKRKVPPQDEFESTKEKILQSDGVVLASPNYIFSVSAQMKAFMNRCCGLVQCMVFEGIYFANRSTKLRDSAPIRAHVAHPHYPITLDCGAEQTPMKETTGPATRGPHCPFQAVGLL
jgi:multimeric flavodoxin WrbA